MNHRESAYFSVVSLVRSTGLEPHKITGFLSCCIKNIDVLGCFFGYI